PHPSPGATTLRVSAPDPIARRWGPVDQRHRYAMPGLQLARGRAGIDSRSLSWARVATCAASVRRSNAVVRELDRRAGVDDLEVARLERREAAGVDPHVLPGH